jgi:hypothetical protein
MWLSGHWRGDLARTLAGSGLPLLTWPVIAGTAGQPQARALYSFRRGVRRRAGGQRRVAGASGGCPAQHQPDQALDRCDRAGPQVAHCAGPPRLQQEAVLLAARRASSLRACMRYSWMAMVCSLVTALIPDWRPQPAAQFVRAVAQPPGEPATGTCRGRPALRIDCRIATSQKAHIAPRGIYPAILSGLCKDF